MPRKKPITLAQVDKARANYEQALRTIIGRPGGRRYADSMRRALTARKRWARVRLAYNAQEFVPAKEQAAQAKASPRAGAAPSGGLHGLRPAGIIVDELRQAFPGVIIHQGNDVIDALLNLPAGVLAYEVSITRPSKPSCRTVKRILQDLAFDAGSGADFDLAAVEAKIRARIFDESRRGRRA